MKLFCALQNYGIKESYVEDRRAHSTTVNITGRETNYTFKYLHFSTRYTFEVKTRLRKGILGEPVHVIATTERFSAPVGPLTATAVSSYSVRLSWSAPPTIDLKKLKVRKLVTLSCCRHGLVGSYTMFGEH